MSGAVSVDWLNLLAGGIAAATGANAVDCTDQARIIFEHLQREHGGGDVYVPVLLREPIDVGAIDVARLRGLPLARACRSAGISRRTYYRMKERQQAEGRKS